MSEIVTFAPSPSIFGFGALQKLPEALESHGIKRLLLITDPRIAEGGILDRVLDLLKSRVEWDLFDGAPPEPRKEDIDEQKERFGSDYDALLGLGGGSSMDFAKGLAVVLSHGGSLGDYLEEDSIPGPVVPVVCVPTTSGTGSQSTQTTVFTIDGVKRGASSEFIRPVLSIVDPELTMGLPPEVTRNAGYDALMHSCESFIARPHDQVRERPFLYQGSNPYSRSLALKAFRSVWTSYRRAVSDGSNREARKGMSLGSHLAGLAFSHSGLGLVHALASSLGGMVNEPHGVCLAACTNIGLSYNLKSCEKDYSILARVMLDIDEPGSSKASPEVFINKMKDIIHELRLPSRPSELGLKTAHARKLLENTLVQTRRIMTNPRPLDDELFSQIEKGI